MVYTILAPAIRISSVSNVALLGRSLADNDGSLTMDGLCAFWAFVSLVFCSAVYLLGRYFSPVLFPCYSKLTKRDQAEWDLRYSSMVFAPLCVWYAYITIWNSDFFFEDGAIPSITRRNETTHTALGIALGFFAVDFIFSLKYFMGGVPMLLHHIFSLLSVGTAIWTGQGHMHTLWMLVTEFTTPFINLRWWLDKADMKSSPIYLYNGVAVFLVWIAARIALFPPFFYVAYYLQAEQVKHLAVLSKFLLYGVPTLLTALNLLWFSKILKGVIKLLTAKPKAKTA